uniref:Major facilitator superfamily (MFS) profile domain-containing protein n=1 Tax=Trichobilharzia regenti TaxID=157069 RepID=A0AA85IZ44_TRIRE|nr:unnamed protein product [Trichobilharzia regenti]
MQQLVQKSLKSAQRVAVGNFLKDLAYLKVPVEFKNSGQYVLFQDLLKVVTGEYNWNRPTQGLILGAFFWGYIITQIPAGLLSLKYGPKWIAFIGVFGCAIVELFVPISSHLNATTVIILRVIEGLFSGLVMSAVSCLMGNWAPAGEKSRFGALTTCGMQMGTIVGQILAGIVSQPRLIDLGTMPKSYMYISYWPYAHYLFGILNILFSALWIFTVYDNPLKHPWISEKEKEYLLETIYTTTTTTNTNDNTEYNKVNEESNTTEKEVSSIGDTKNEKSDDQKTRLLCTFIGIERGIQFYGIDLTITTISRPDEEEVIEKNIIYSGTIRRMFGDILNHTLLPKIYLAAHIVV